jgi:DNA-binding MarR family transcriptional regulator
MARKKSKGTELSVFSGREAKLNRAILQTLSEQGLLTIYDVHKKVKEMKGLGNTRYANVNLRVKSLEKKGFVIRTGTKETKAGFTAALFETTTRAYLALVLDPFSKDDLVNDLDEATALILLSSILSKETIVYSRSSNLLDNVF